MQVYVYTYNIYIYIYIHIIYTYNIYIYIYIHKQQYIYIYIFKLVYMQALLWGSLPGSAPTVMLAKSEMVGGFPGSDVMLSLLTLAAVCDAAVATWQK